MSASQFWDERYRHCDFLYSSEANQFLRENCGILTEKGHILVPGDGDGRNGIALAKQGFRVTAFDYSAVAVEKANRLAQGMDIGYHSHVQDANDFRAIAAGFDGAVWIFLHLPTSLRQKLLGEIVHSLKPGGSLILQVFAKEQLGRDSGGPKDLDLLCSGEDFVSLFSEFQKVSVEKDEVELNEGPLHRGRAVVYNVKAINRIRP